MKKGFSYITINSKSHPNHLIIKKLKDKGVDFAEVIYASPYSSNSGWTIVKSSIPSYSGFGWLGYTKKEAVEYIKSLNIVDNYICR